MISLSIKDLRVRLSEFDILKGVSFDVRKGSVVCLLGPSGCGKTTLLRAVAGLESASEGFIRVGQQTLMDAGSELHVPANQRNLGFVFQSYALWPHMTVEKNVAYGLKVRGGLDSAARQSRVNEVLENVGLRELALRYPHELSGGQQQRVALARALVYDPPVILLDEPLSNLDAKLRHEARAWLRGVIVRLGLSAICVTHDQDEAMALADTIVLMRAGRIEQSGTPQSLYNEPLSPFVAEFFGVSNRLEGELGKMHGDHAIVRVSGHDLQVRTSGFREVPEVGSAVSVVFRADEANLKRGPVPGDLPVVLEASRYFGRYWEHQCRFGSDAVRVFGNERLEPGEYAVRPGPATCWCFGSS